MTANCDNPPDTSCEPDTPCEKVPDVLYAKDGILGVYLVCF